MSTASKRASARKTCRTEWVERWSPPKPMVGLQAIEKVLNRHTFLVCPESCVQKGTLPFYLFYLVHRLRHQPDETVRQRSGRT